MDSTATTNNEVPKELPTVVAKGPLYEIVWRKTEIPKEEKSEIPKEEKSEIPKEEKSEISQEEKSEIPKEEQSEGVEPLATKPLWLVFADSIVSMYLRNRLVEQDNNVCLIMKAEEFSNEGCLYKLDPMEKSPLTKVWETVNADELEGIIYMWDLNTTNEVDQSVVFKPLLNVIQELITLNIRKRFFIVTRGALCVDIEYTRNPSMSTLVGLLKGIQAEDPALEFKYLDLDPSNHNLNANIDDIISVLSSKATEIQYASRNREMYIPRLTKLTIPVEVEIPKSSRFSVKVPASNFIADLELITANISNNLQEHEVEVSVIAVGLNYRDINVLTKPEGWTTKYPLVVGTEFSGVISNVGSAVTNFVVGDAVFGISWNGAIGSHTVVHESFAAKKPKHLSHFEAACLPVAFATSWHSVVTVGQLTDKDTILIHTASGGVGLMAVKIAQKIGTKIIATAGNERKRMYLKSIGVENVFDSRTTDYLKKVQEVTTYKDMVSVAVNTLSGKDFKDKSLKCCNENARFIELSKTNILGSDYVAVNMPNLKYTTFDLEELENIRDIISNITEDFSPVIPYTRFGLGQFKAAFDHLHKHQHIGKVVIAIPQFEIEKGQSKLTCKLFNAESTYIITEGFTGVGLEVTKWMIRCGAKFVVLISEDNPDGRVSKILKELNSKGADVITLQADVAKYDECENAFNEIKKGIYPPLRGIIHAAEALADDVIEKQSWENFELSFGPKVIGTWNLHKLSLAYNLEHFILFSSTASSVGATGRTSFISANTFLDSFAHYRRGLGLPAQSVNWGPWSAVEMSKNSSQFSGGALGISSLSTKNALAALTSILQSRPAQITATELEPSVTLDALQHLKPYLSELLTSKRDKNTGKLPE